MAAMELYAIAPTQFDDTGRVDLRAMAANSERLAKDGISRFLLTGSYGEFTNLSDGERLDILRTVKQSGAASDIMACAASLSTQATIDLARAMLDGGATSAMVAVPLATELTDSDVLCHFEALSQKLGSSLVVYNNPVFGYELSPELLREVAAMPGYVAIKQGSRDVAAVLRAAELVRSTSSVRTYIASDLTAALTLAAPVDGLTSTNSWVFPQAFITLVQAAERGDTETMHGISASLTPYRREVAAIGQPAAVKAAMQLRGYAGSSAVRLPYSAASSADVQRLRSALQECDAHLESVRPTQEAIA